MKRVVLLLSLMGVTVALTATAAFAITDYGTNGNDTLVGTADRDFLYGLRGNDVIRGLGDADLLSGGPGNDTVRGAGGLDEIGLGPGHDTAYGGWGQDLIVGHLGDDDIYGEGGPDTIVVQDGVRGNDLAACGPGDDIAYVDSAFEVDTSTCERFTTEPYPNPI